MVLIRANFRASVFKFIQVNFFPLAGAAGCKQSAQDCEQEIISQQCGEEEEVEEARNLVEYARFDFLESRKLAF